MQTKAAKISLLSGSGIFFFTLLAVTGCGPSDVDEMGTAVTRAKPGWVRVVNLTEGPLSADIGKTRLLTDDAAKTWRAFVPVSPGDSSIDLKGSAGTAKQSVAVKADSTLSVFVSGSKELQVATFTSESRSNEQDGGSVLPILLEDGKVTAVPTSSVKAKDGAKLTMDDLNQTLLVPEGPHTLTVTVGGLTASVDGQFEPKVAYTLLLHKTGSKLEGYVLRNSASNQRPQAQGVSKGG